MTGKIWLFQGDSELVLRALPSESVHTVCTSPPYLGLRDYNCAGQIGLEGSVEEYVARLVGIFREVRRVLHPTGTVWLNMGDSYARNPAKGQHKPGDSGKQAYLYDQGAGRSSTISSSQLTPKNLIGVPWRIAFALQADGWILRSDIVWAKSNVLPESVEDRPTRCHEYIFLFAKSSRYFYDGEAIREPAVCNHSSGNGFQRPEQLSRGGRGSSQPWQPTKTKNRRSVWSINVRPFKGSHFAVFPAELPERCLLAGTSEHGCCQECGTPYRRIVEKGEPDAEWQKQCGADTAGEYHGQATKDYASAGAQNASATKARILAGMRERKTVGWQKQCGCDTDQVSPCTVLDPFAGSGTTGAVAIKHGRNAVLIELNPSYCELIKDRVGRENVCNQ